MAPRAVFPRARLQAVSLVVLAAGGLVERKWTPRSRARLFFPEGARKRVPRCGRGVTPPSGTLDALVDVSLLPAAQGGLREIRASGTILLRDGSQKM